MARRNSTVGDALKRLAAEGRVTAGRATRPGNRERVQLPLPPSTNNLYRNAGKRGRVPTREYEAWKAVADGIAATLMPPASYPCRFRWLLHGKINQGRDGDNTLKALLDAAVRVGVIPDDSLKYVRAWVGEYIPSSVKPYATIWFEPMGGVA